MYGHRVSAVPIEMYFSTGKQGFGWWYTSPWSPWLGAQLLYRDVHFRARQVNQQVPVSQCEVMNTIPWGATRHNSVPPPGHPPACQFQNMVLNSAHEVKLCSWGSLRGCLFTSDFVNTATVDQHANTLALLTHII
jgi:hypothetical protein